MTPEPIWKLKSFDTNFPTLQKNLTVDVAVIGGGITGITTAQLLCQQGMKVVVLEARKVGQGTTGHSTGNLYDVTEYRWEELKKKHDLSILKQITESRREIVAFISENVEELKLDCDFEVVPMYIFENDETTNIDKEKEIANEIGLSFTEISMNEVPIPFHAGIKYEAQAQLNPLSYVQQLAMHVSKDGCSIYENTHVNSIEEDKLRGEVVLKTDYAEIKADYVVHATHTPLGLQLQYHPVLGPYREYGIAAKVQNNPLGKGIYWGNYSQGKYSLRRYDVNNESYLICIGSMHKTGQTDDNEAHIRELIDFTQKHFQVKEITHKWGGQNYKPADPLPYIGRKEKGSRQFVATGYSTDGLVYGSLSARIITDAIVGTKSLYNELYKASRHKPIKAADKFVSENINVAGQLIKDLIHRGEDFKDIELAADEGKVVQLEDNKVAVYKNAHGHTTILSAICPHMGCTVHWNNAEKSWDCPCHGSRFDTTGKVIEGPALSGLKGKDE